MLLSIGNAAGVTSRGVSQELDRQLAGGASGMPDDGLAPRPGSVYCPPLQGVRTGRGASGAGEA